MPKKMRNRKEHSLLKVKEDLEVKEVEQFTTVKNVSLAKQTNIT